MKKLLNVVLIVAICFSSFSFVAFAQEEETVYSFECGDNSFCYYKDKQGNPYIVENGIKYYVAIPEYVEKVTDEAQLEILRKEFASAKLQNSARSNILFEQTIYFSSLPSTGVLSVSDNYLFLKCSKLNPSNATRGFSYWIFYPLDKNDAESEWERAFFANKSLFAYTRHDMAVFGHPDYIKIEIFSYYGSVSSCLFSVKEGGVLG